jgi:hypothetical protein
MSRVTSRDGTSIAYERSGEGPAVIMVGGGLIDPATGRAGRAENEPLAAELARRFTVYNYDRRGRAESGDTPPYAVEHEIEDIAADSRMGEAPVGFFDDAAAAIVAIIPHSERRTIETQSHVVDPKAFAPVLERFFSA